MPYRPPRRWERVGRRSRQSALLAEIEEQPLELRAREGGGPVVRERRVQGPQAVPAAAAADQPFDRAKVEELQPL
jgi:hypothetical protein